MELRKTFRFEASHILPKHPGKCSRLHGHSWVLHVFVSGSVNPETGFVMDFADISKVVKPLVESLDHHHLGTWHFTRKPAGEVTFEDFALLSSVVENLPDDFYPSSENLLWWIGEQLRVMDRFEYTHKNGVVEIIDAKPGQTVDIEPGETVDQVQGWSKLALEETCTSYCELTREEFDARGR